MPCDSSYLNPSQREENTKLVAELICYVDQKIKIKTPDNIVKSSKDYYGEGSDLTKTVPLLCSKIKALNQSQFNSIVYNGKSKESRKLADWWEAHEEADRKREERVKEAKDHIAAKKSAMSKLTQQERKALGL